MISSWIRFLLKHQRRLIPVALVSAAALGAWIPRLEAGKQKSAWFSKDDPSLAEYKSLKHRFQVDLGILAAFVPTDPIGTTQLAALNEFAEGVRGLPYVTRVLTAADGLGAKDLSEMSDEAAMARVSATARRVPFGRYLLNQKADTLGVLIDIWIPEKDLVRDAEIAAALIDRMTALAKKVAPLLGEPLMAGDVVVDNALNLSIGEDVARMLPLSILIAVGILFFFLRKVRRIMWPLAAVLCALVSTLGIMALVGAPFTVVSTSLFAVIVIIGVSDSIHIMERYVCLLSANLEDAAFQTMREAAPPCFFTSVTTALGFLSLAFSPVPMVQSLGLFSALGIMLSFIFVMIMCPAAFRHAEPAAAPTATFLDRILSVVSETVLNVPRRTVAFFVLGTVGISLLGGFQVGTDGRFLTYFRESSAIRRDTVRLEARLGGVGFNEIIINGRSGMFLSESNLQKLAAASTRIAASVSVDQAVSGADLFALAGESTGGNVMKPTPYEIVAQDKMAGKNSFAHFFTRDFGAARIRYAESSMIAPDRRIPKAELEGILRASFPSCDVHFTGYGALAERANQNVVETLMKSLIGSFSTVFLLMLFLFGIKGGLLSLLPNLGAVAILPSLMGILGYRLNIGTAIIAAVTIGIVVDDTIHLFWHYKRLRTSGGGATASLRRTVREVGRPMVVTSVMFVFGFNVFLVSKLAMLRDFGLLSSFIVTAALAFDLCLSTALLKLFHPFQPAAASRSARCRK